MPRIARVTAVGYPHHITQKGNYRQTVFDSEDDYIQYLQWLKEYCYKYSLKICAYCLMSNHVHFIGIPMKDDSLAKTFNTLHMRYSQYFNQKRKVKGHLWQGRFYSCILDERHLYAAIRYVENNPVKAGIVGKPYEYRWSSAKGHIYKTVDPVLSDDCYLINEIDDWVSYLMEKEDDVTTNDIRRNTKTGRPCGDEVFIETIERFLNKRLRSLPRGRPAKGK